MKLEQQVVSLDLAKKMKVLGYPQEGLWWWGPDMEMNYVLTNDVRGNEVYNSFYGAEAVAPTVAELGEALPRFYASEQINKEAWQVYNADDTEISVVEDTEANARAKMWIYLKEKGLIKVKEQTR